MWGGGVREDLQHPRGVITVEVEGEMFRAKGFRVSGLGLQGLGFSNFWA